MANKNKETDTCLFVYNNGKRCDRDVQGHGLCGTHYQKALKTIKQSKEGKLIGKNGKPVTNITWDYLIEKGKALPSQRTSGQTFFLD